MAAAWSRSALAEVTLDLLRARGRDIRTTLITDVVPFDEGPAFLGELAGRRSGTLQAVLRVDGG
jgi:hypothetical protein